MGGDLELLRLDLLERAHVSRNSILRLDLLDCLVTRLSVRACLVITQGCCAHNAVAIQINSKSGFQRIISPHWLYCL